MYPGATRTPDEHGADREDLLCVGVGADVAEAHAGQTGEGEVEGSDVCAVQRRAADGAVDKGLVQAFAQLVEPPFKGEEHGVGE